MENVDIVRAVSALRRGGLVVLPTETVYGLAADATDPQAVARIYAVKGRPADHPLILHLASVESLDRWVAEIPAYARRLVAAAWPGPLTVVLRRSELVGDHVTGGQDTVAVRVPDHPSALAVLAGFGGAVAAPSANLFGHVSPTSLEHVTADLGDRLIAGVDVALDGGPCAVGVESTIVDCTGAAPVILRPGHFDADHVTRMSGVSVVAAAGGAPRVSGALAAHYAPRAEVVMADDAAAATPGVGLIAPVQVATPAQVVRLMAPESAEDYAQRLYWALREADALQLDRVVVVLPIGDAGVAAAIRDRVERAAAGSRR